MSPYEEFWLCFADLNDYLPKRRLSFAGGAKANYKSLLEQYVTYVLNLCL